MTTMMQASRQWATRPDDERYLSLTEMHSHFERQRAQSRELVVSTRKLHAAPVDDGIVIEGPNGNGYEPTHWCFGQVATLAQAPASYLRTLPAPMVADCLNYGLQYKRDIAEVGILLARDEAGVPQIRAATGPKYGRVWNLTVLAAMIRQFGDGRTGQFRVPGEFGHEVEVTKANTTLYASDRDFFVFLTDERNRIEVPNRRDGTSGMMARGFFVWNSEVGAQTLGVTTFLFDYVCCNRIVWGAEQINEIRIRHTVSAPDRFIEQVAPALQRYADGSTHNVVKAIEDARSKRIQTDVEAWLANRFTRPVARAAMAAHLADEDRPIETVWDAVTGLTAAARDIPHQDARVDLERAAGALLN